MKNLILTSLLFIACITLTAQNTWLGGNSHWNDFEKWSYGTVPTADESVLIENGVVEVQSGQAAYALRMQIVAGGSLDIKSGGSLTIDGLLSSALHGIMLGGNLTVRGRLTVRNIGNGDGVANFGAGTFSVTSGGQAQIRDIDSDGIWNTANINVSGRLSIRNVGNHGILNYGSIENSGQFNISNASGAITCWANANFVNSGSFSCSSVGTGISLVSSSFAINHPGGHLNIRFASTYGISVLDNNNNFYNFGTIDLTEGNKQNGINNEYFFSNYEGGVINIDNATTGIFNAQGADFWNDGLVAVGSLNAVNSLWNNGEFLNDYCGRLETDHKWGNIGGAIFENEGNWYHDAGTPSINLGQVINGGVIEDYQGTFPSFTNDEIRARPIPNAILPFVPIEDALDLGTVDRYTVNGWYTSADLTHSAGDYIEQRNRWIPNRLAVGLSEVFVRLDHNAGSCDAVVRVALPNNVAPITTPGMSNTLLGEQAGTQTHSNLVYPNPSNGIFTIQTSAQHDGLGTFQLFDLTGRILWQVEQQLGSPFILTVPSELESGIYQLVIRSNGESLGTERLVIER